MQTRRSRGRTGLVAGLVAALAALWLVIAQWDVIRGWFREDAPAPAAESAGPPPESGAPEDAPPGAGPPAATWAGLFEVAPQWPERLGGAAACDAIATDLGRMCAVLDRESRNVFADAGGACAAIEQAARALAGRSPAEGELGDRGALLGNVFHVSRALGVERTRAVARLLRERPELAEPAALVLFEWAASRPRCAGPGEPRLEGRALYEHAAFLFHTLGGQAYLRRRAPRIEALASFYALVALDLAIEGGYNPQGIDPRPEIARTTALIETQPLAFRERYLARLEELRSRWARRG